jgi:hypothetical protein
VEYKRKTRQFTKKMYYCNRKCYELHNEARAAKALAASQP